MRTERGHLAPHPTGQSLLAAHGVACPTLAGRGGVPTLDDLSVPEASPNSSGTW